jgi:hypothetical protein
MKPSPKFINDLQKYEVFVFGSNLEGRHGVGAALQAYKSFGAIYGKGIGFGFGEKSYAIPTRKFIKYNNKWKLVTLPLIEIGVYIDNFLKLASVHKELNFLCVEIGCGYAGYIPEEIAWLFIHADKIDNVFLPQRFIEVLENGKK